MDGHEEVVQTWKIDASEPFRHFPCCSDNKENGSDSMKNSLRRISKKSMRGTRTEMPQSSLWNS